MLDEKPQTTPAGTGYTLKADPSSVLQGYSGGKEDMFFYTGYDTDDQKVLAVEINHVGDIYFICLSYNEEYIYIYSLSPITNFEDSDITITAGEWNKIIIGDNLELDENFGTSNFPFFDGYVTAGEDNESDNGLTLEDANDYFGEIFVLAQ